MASVLRVACQCVLASPKQIVHQNSAYVSRIDHHDRQKVEMSRLEEAENKKKLLIIRLIFFSKLGEFSLMLYKQTKDKYKKGRTAHHVNCHLS